MKAIRKFWGNCWHLLWACVPGCGQMCQGYMKRGISQTIIVTALLFIAVFLEMGVLAVLIAPLWLYSFFDSFNLRRQIRDGLAPEDEFLFGMSELDSRKLTQILSRRGSLIGWVLMAVGLYNLYRIFAQNILGGLADMFPWLNWLYHLLVWDAPRILGTVFVIALGLWFIKGPKAPKGGGFDEEPSYTPPKAEPPKMKSTPWTEAEEQFHQEPEPQAPAVPEEPEEPAPVTLEWKSEFNVEKYEKELAEKKEADHDGQ
nr:hypothetical protein [uncultured Oscillibacter sp.]